MSQFTIFYPYSFPKSNALYINNALSPTPTSSYRLRVQQLRVSTTTPHQQEENEGNARRRNDTADAPTVSHIFDAKEITDAIDWSSGVREDTLLRDSPSEMTERPSLLLSSLWWWIWGRLLCLWIVCVQCMTELMILIIKYFLVHDAGSI